jgi:hypothetical protein
MQQQIGFPQVESASPSVAWPYGTIFFSGFHFLKVTGLRRPTFAGP